MSCLLYSGKATTLNKAVIVATYMSKWITVERSLKTTVMTGKATNGGCSLKPTQLDTLF